MGTTPSSSDAASSADTSDDQESPSSSTTATTRYERYEKAVEEGKSMSISSLKQELKDRRISTSSFFEKFDLVKAYANAIADDTKDKDSKSRNASRRSEQSFDPSYRNVIMHTLSNDNHGRRGRCYHRYHHVAHRVRSSSSNKRS